jgi:hypothetical protein
METTDYEGWVIKTHFTTRGYGAVMTSPCGDTFQQPTICWQSHRSARRYAQKFIDWYIKLDSQHQNQEASLSNTTQCSEVAAQQ